MATANGETPAAQTDLVLDGERFVPGAGVGIAYEHWTRYALAAEMIGGRDLLEVACGEGYGSAFLSRAARSVRSFDASPQAIAHAKRTYAGTSVDYQQNDVRSFFEKCPDGSFDAVVAFEIIEHLTVEDQAFLLEGIRRVLRPDGFALISTPDKRIYTDASLAVNPFHIREYYREEFEAELKSRFPHVRLLDQALFTGCAIVEAGVQSARTVQMAWSDQRTAQGTARPGLRVSGEYVVALVGKAPTPEPPSLILADFSRRLIAEGLQSERRTADRLARELEEARRAWEGAMAGTAHERARAESALEETRRVREAAAEAVLRADAEVEAERKVFERRAAELERNHAAARQAQEAVVASATRLLEQERARRETLWHDFERLQEEMGHARRTLRDLRESKDRHPARRLLTVGRILGQVPKRHWFLPTAAASSLRSLVRKHKDAVLIENSGLLDREYYLAENRDVAQSGTEPLEHFLQHGVAERRNPHPLFDVGYYLATNPDVAMSGANPLVHFLAHGWRERRKPNEFFDTVFYLARNPDVAAAGINPLIHFLEHGAAEGRDPGPEFQIKSYLAEFPEVAASGRNPLVHFLRNRGQSLRSPSALSSGEQKGLLARWRAEMATRTLRALVVDLSTLTPDRDSGSVTTLEQMKSLQSLGYAVTFIPADLQHSERYAQALEGAGFWTLTGRAIPSLQQFLKANGELFEVAMLCRVDVAAHLVALVRARCPNAVLLFETMDLHYLRAEREAALTGSKEAERQAQATKAVELDVVRRADATIVHSDVEMEILRREVPEAALHRLSYVLEVRGQGPGFEERKDLVFLGSFRHKPNVDAVTWFVREIFPRIRQKLPGVRFRIVGSDPGDEVKSLATEDVIVTGYVERLEPVFDSCRLTVAPLRYGAGYKGKVAMSLAHGVPAVLSSIAAEGMELVHEGQVLIADDPGRFAAEVIRLYRDQVLWERLSRAGLEFAALRFSPKAARHQIAQILRAAGANLSPEKRAEQPTARPAPRPEPGLAIFPSRFMRELHRELGVQFQDSALVPHGVTHHHAPDAPRADRLQFVEPGVLHLLFAGRVTDFKGLHTSIEALPAVVKSLPDLEVRLTVVGDSSDSAYVDRCRRLAAELQLGEHVRFLPPTRENELFALFQRHDVYLFPSLFEPFALTLILALEAGIPTVASAAGGNVDLVIDHGTGLLFPAGDAARLAAAVEELARNPALRRSVSEAGRAAAGKLTVDAMMDGIEAALQKAAGRAPSASARE